MTKIIDSEGIFKRRKSDQARMDQLRITEGEMIKFYPACGSEGQHWDQAFTELKNRFHLNPSDAEFVEKVLGDCGPF
jgi:hypothetical protein